ncbi:SCAN domain-containing protein 3-like [Palaemon carinicauda]|uniref:SCAN domain-containing protein 3-like n=1 Tax=Palaemon carinicauda TaxID=392227 RepID=UPI0035B571EF
MICLRALQTKTAEEVAFHLVDISCDKGAPHILQSDNGREFSNKVVKEVLAMWPECKLVHGKPRYSQSQDSVERENRDVETILACWMKDNATQWSNGLRFVRWQKNRRFHSGIGRTPCEAMYGEKAHLGISTVNIPEEIMEGMETEEQLAEALCLVNEEDQNIEQGRIAESCAINCNSCGQNIPCHPSGQFCSTVNDNVDDPVFCCLCTRNRSIQAERRESKIQQEKQAKIMKDKSVKCFKAVLAGDTVMVSIPLVGRGRAEFANAKAIITETMDGGTYKLGTKHGLLKQVYSRNQFTLCA